MSHHHHHYKKKHYSHCDPCDSPPHCGSPPPVRAPLSDSAYPPPPLSNLLPHSAVRCIVRVVLPTAIFVRHLGPVHPHDPDASLWRLPARTCGLLPASTARCLPASPTRRLPTTARCAGRAACLPRPAARGLSGLPLPSSAGRRRASADADERLSTAGRSRDGRDAAALRQWRWWHAASAARGLWAAQPCGADQQHLATARCGPAAVRRSPRRTSTPRLPFPVAAGMFLGLHTHLSSTYTRNTHTHHA